MFSVADFPSGNVRVTVYSGGKSLSSSRLQYYTRIEELSHLLSSVADPVEFMSQVKTSVIFYLKKLYTDMRFLHYTLHCFLTIVYS